MLPHSQSKDARNIVDHILLLSISRRIRRGGVKNEVQNVSILSSLRFVLEGLSEADLLLSDVVDITELT